MNQLCVKKGRGALTTLRPLCVIGLSAADKLDCAAVGNDVYVYVSLSVSSSVDLKALTVYGSGRPYSGNVYLNGKRHIVYVVALGIGKSYPDLAVCIA